MTPGGKLGHAQRRQRRQFRLLHHHAVAGGQGGAELPAGEHQREIPGHHLPHHAHRHAGHIVQKAGVDGNHHAFVLVGHAREIAEGRHGAQHIQVARIADGVPRIQALDERQVIAIPFDRVSQLADQHAAIGRRHGGPGRKGLARRSHRAIDIRRPRLRHLCQQRVVEGIEDIEGATLQCIDEFVVDEQLGLEFWLVHAHS
jgi:hypothetical protein